MLMLLLPMLCVVIGVGVDGIVGDVGIVDVVVRAAIYVFHVSLFYNSIVFICCDIRYH